MNLTKRTVSNPVLVIVVFALICIMGLSVAGNLEINLMPDITHPYMFVYARYDNASPETVETAVTQPLEDQLISVSSLKNITSSSYEGYCNIVMEFNYGTDIDTVAVEVRDSIERIREYLPKTMKTPQIFKINTKDMPVMELAVMGERSDGEIKYIAENTVKKLLDQASGVAQTSVYGGKVPAVCVELNQNRMSAFGLTASQVTQKLAAQNLDLGAGKITEGNRYYVLRTKGEYSSLEEIADTIIFTKKDYNIKVSDIATVYMGFEEVDNEVYINGKPGIYLSVSKQSGSNIVQVADNVFQKIEEIKKVLPSDIQIEVIEDYSDFIRDALNILTQSAWQGILLAIAVLFIFLKSFKSTFIISISIPVSIIITMLLMHLTHITLNLMTLTGLILGIGMVVDSSIVMIDNIYSYRVRGTKPVVAAILGTQEMISSVASGNMTTIVVFVPFILCMTELGWVGLYVKDLIYTIVIAIVSSLFSAVFLVPVLAGVYLPLTNRAENPVKTKGMRALYNTFEKGFEFLEKVYKKILSKALHRPKTTIFCAIAVLIGSFMLARFVNVEPGFDMDFPNTKLQFTLPVGSTLETTSKVVREFEGFVEKEVQGYKSIIASIGNGEGNQGSANMGSLKIYLPKLKDQIDSVEVIQDKLAKHFKDYAGVKFIFSNSNMNSMSNPDININVSGQDLESVKRTANQIIDVLEEMGTLKNVQKDMNDGLPQIEIQVDRKRASEAGVSIDDVARELNNCIAGVSATRYRTNGKEFNIMVSYSAEDKSNVLNLDMILVPGKTGTVPMSRFAQLVKNNGPVGINHDNRARIINVTGEFKDKGNVLSMDKAVMQEIKKKCIIPEDVIIKNDGSGDFMKSQGAVFIKIIVLAILLVFGVMAGVYGSFKKPLINMLTIPFMAIGVILIYVITRESFNIMCMLGIIMLVGIVVNNGIILVDYTGLLVERGTEVKEACLNAGVSRLRPVLMTTLTTVLGMLPLCFSNEGSAALVQPIGLCVSGGLISSTIVTLVIIPVIYSLMCKKEKSTTIMLANKEKGASEIYVESGKFKRVEIIANQSIQTEIIDSLETAIGNIQYTLEENLYGRGLSSRKLGDSIWPEMNFRMVLYIEENYILKISECIKIVAEKFPDEGLCMFTM